MGHRYDGGAKSQKPGQILVGIDPPASLGEILSRATAAIEEDEDARMVQPCTSSFFFWPDSSLHMPRDTSRRRRIIDTAEAINVAHMKKKKEKWSTVLRDCDPRRTRLSLDRAV